MGKCFQVDLKVNCSYTLLMVFEAMKQMQKECSLIDESVTISFDDKIKLTAGFYDDFETFYDLFMSVLYNDKEFIMKHVRTVFPNYLDSGVIDLAVNNIIESLNLLDKGLTREEKEELIKLSGIKGRRK